MIRAWSEKALARLGLVRREAVDEAFKDGREVGYRQGRADMLAEMQRKGLLPDLPTGGRRLVRPTELPSPISALRPSRREVTIVYEDANGEITERVITIMRSEGNVITAFCHHRGALRTFRRDRVESAVDADTQEKIDPVNL